MQVREFVKLLSGQKYIHGYNHNTLKSLMLTLLPKPGFNTGDGLKGFEGDTISSCSTEVYFIKNILRALNNTGFNWPQVCYILVWQSIQYHQLYVWRQPMITILQPKSGPNVQHS